MTDNSKELLSIAKFIVRHVCRSRRSGDSPWEYYTKESDLKWLYDKAHKAVDESDSDAKGDK